MNETQLGLFKTQMEIALRTLLKEALNDAKRLPEMMHGMAIINAAGIFCEKMKKEYPRLKQEIEESNQEFGLLKSDYYKVIDDIASKVLSEFIEMPEDNSFRDDYDPRFDIIEDKEKSDYIIESAARLLFQEKKLQEAILYIDQNKSEVSNEKLPILLRLKGIGLGRLGKFETAIEQYKEAITSVVEYQSDDLDSLVLLYSDMALMYAELKNEEEAFKNIGFSIELANDSKNYIIHYEIYKKLAQLYNIYGDMEGYKYAKEQSEKYYKIHNNR